MKERGMIFNGEMVRAILDGRKTQTRRPVKFPVLDKNLGCELAGNELAGELSAGNYLNSAFGKPGDRIWVRETWGVVSHAFSEDGLIIDWVPDRPATAIHEMLFGNGYYSGYAIYAVDGDFTWGDDDGYEDGRSCWKPSIHMPRAASRILLEITDVRVERLNAISPEDAESEGLERTNFTGFGDEPGLPSYPEPDVYFDPLKKQWKEYPPEAFAGLWESIYGEGSWQANPWVWVIEFKRVEGGAA
ncbi:hypothetical protein ACYA1N_24815 [Klebsiella pneumoniae]